MLNIARAGISELRSPYLVGTWHVAKQVSFDISRLIQLSLFKNDLLLPLGRSVWEGELLDLCGEGQLLDKRVGGKVCC